MCAPRRNRNKHTTMSFKATGWARAGVLVLAAGFLVSVSQAQQPPTPPRPQAKTAPPAARDLPPGSDAGLQRLVEQLEEQLVDLQVVIGTLESLARGGAAASSSPAGGMALSASDAG